MSGFSNNSIRLSALGDEDDDDIVVRSDEPDSDKWNIFNQKSGSSKQIPTSGITHPKQLAVTESIGARSEKGERAGSAATASSKNDGVNEISELIESFDGRSTNSSNAASKSPAKPKRPRSPPKVSKKAPGLGDTRDLQSSLDSLIVSTMPIHSNLESHGATQLLGTKSESGSLSEVRVPSISTPNVIAVPSRASQNQDHSQSSVSHAQSFTSTPSGGSPTCSSSQMQPRVNSTTSLPQVATATDSDPALRSESDQKLRSNSDDNRRLTDEMATATGTKLRSRTSLDDNVIVGATQPREADAATGNMRVSSASLTEIAALSKSQAHERESPVATATAASTSTCTSAVNDVEQAIASVSANTNTVVREFTKPQPILIGSKLDTQRRTMISKGTETEQCDAQPQPAVTNVPSSKRVDQQVDSLKRTAKELPWLEFSCVVMVVFAYHVIALPREVYFFLAGALAVATMWLLQTLLAPLRSARPVGSDPPSPSHLLTSPFGQQWKPLFAIEPQIRAGSGCDYFSAVTATNNQLTFRTWMNELDTHVGNVYTPADYHISQTVSALVTLEHTTLRIGRPRTNVPRRAVVNEHAERYLSDPRHKITSTRSFALHEGAIVCLLPFELVRKRFWSKKYPICVVVPHKRGASFPSRASAERNTSLSFSDKLLNGGAHGNGSATNSSVYAHFSALIDTTPSDATSSARVPDFDSVAGRLKELTLDQCDIIYLFTRTCVEKEIWYKRLRDACLNVPRTRTLPQLFGMPSASGQSSASSEHEQSSSPFEVLEENERMAIRMPTDTSLIQFGEYMARYLPAEWIQQLVDRTGQSQSQSQAQTPSGQKSLPTQSALQIVSGIAQATHALLNAHMITCDAELVWCNALLGRLFYDFLHRSEWRTKVQRKIQKKLSTLKIPHFIETFRVTEVQLGCELPVLRKATGGAYLDEDGGLWFDLDVAYRGNFYMQIETKVNLMRLKRDKPLSAEKVSFRANSKHPHILSMNSDDQSSELIDTEMRDIASLCSCSNAQDLASGAKREREHSPFCRLSRVRKTSNSVSKRAIVESDEEDSGESSTDSESEQKGSTASTPDGEKHLDMMTASMALPAPPNKEANSSTGRRFLNVIDRISASSYFQKATEFGVIKRAMESVSNTPVLLNVSLESLEGRLAVHIGAPPTDRLWYGFRTPPKMRLLIKPKLGERQVTISHIIDFIERKLTQEFQRVLVMPNMDDVVVPFMSDMYSL